MNKKEIEIKIKELEGAIEELQEEIKHCKKYDLDY